MKTLDLEQLATVTGGIVEGGCVIPDPWFTGLTERLKNIKVPTPKGQPADLGSIGTTRPK